MILLVVSVRDRAADAFGRPFFVHTLGLAIRSFQDEVNRKAADNPMCAHPEDYDLYHLGAFDDSTGQLVSPPDCPKQIAIGKQMVKGEDAYV